MIMDNRNMLKRLFLMTNRIYTPAGDPNLSDQLRIYRRLLSERINLDPRRLP